MADTNKQATSDTKQFSSISDFVGEAIGEQFDESVDTREALNFCSHPRKPPKSCLPKSD